jgi:hypothetical protein
VERYEEKRIFAKNRKKKERYSELLGGIKGGTLEKGCRQLIRNVFRQTFCILTLSCRFFEEQQAECDMFAGWL